MCKSKWKSLRDNYRREYKKIAILKVHDSSACSNWVHFNSLGFLEKVNTKKQLQSAQSSFESENCNELPKKSNDDDDVETIVIESSDADDDIYHDNYKYIRQQEQQKRHKNWLLKQRKKIHCCPHSSSEDEIVHFFKSIAPYLAMMDSTMRLRVRIEIQEIILNELSRKIDAAREKIINDSHLKPKRASKRIVKRNRKYL